MNEATTQLRPQAVAEYIRYRFRVQPGQSLCIALGHPDELDNFGALNAWTVGAVKRHAGGDVDEQIARIESELCQRMLEAGIVDQILEPFPVPVGVIAQVCAPSRTKCRKRPRSQHRLAVIKCTRPKRSAEREVARD